MLYSKRTRSSINNISLTGKQFLIFPKYPDSDARMKDKKCFHESSFKSVNLSIRRFLQKIKAAVRERHDFVVPDNPLLLTIWET